MINKKSREFSLILIFLKFKGQLKYKKEAIKLWNFFVYFLYLALSFEEI
jgi:hypothetical protein